MTSYCSISQEVNAIRQLNLVNSQNITTEIFFFKKDAENEAGRLVSDFFCFFLKKALFEVKVSGLELSFNIF